MFNFQPLKISLPHFFVVESPRMATKFIMTMDNRQSNAFHLSEIGASLNYP